MLISYQPEPPARQQPQNSSLALRVRMSLTAEARLSQDLLRDHPKRKSLEDSVQRLPPQSSFHNQHCGDRFRLKPCISRCAKEFDWLSSHAMRGRFTQRMAECVAKSTAHDFAKSGRHSSNDESLRRSPTPFWGVGDHSGSHCCLGVRKSLGQECPTYSADNALREVAVFEQDEAEQQHRSNIRPSIKKAVAKVIRRNDSACRNSRRHVER